MVPLSGVDAAELVRAPRAAPLLPGYRGGAPARLDALEDLVLRVSRLAEVVPEVRSLVLRPVIAGADGVAVAGAGVVLVRRRRAPRPGLTGSLRAGCAPVGGGGGQHGWEAGQPGSDQSDLPR